MKDWQVIHGDALDVLKTLDALSVDSLVTDPPAGISFMGKGWDGDHGGRDAWVGNMAGLFAECLRVLKPGAHAFVWGLPRTSHWTATALEDAGFEIRDVVTHHYGSGFPKSHNLKDDWSGWGTALKPASEHWILARKPLAGTVAANVLEHGAGALNVDGCRVGSSGGTRKAGPPSRKPGTSLRGSADGSLNGGGVEALDAGRWPPNLVLTHAADCTEETCGESCPVAEMDRQSGTRQSGTYNAMGYHGNGRQPMPAIEGDSGGASRFFPRFRYEAKASSGERNAGLEGMPEGGGDRSASVARCSKCGKTLKSGEREISPCCGELPRWEPTRPVANHHPTVKSIALMQWLCRLITPPDGLVLDPFTGSGTTGVAALREGFRFVGIEREPEYAEIAQRRIEEDMPLFSRQRTAI